MDCPHFSNETSSFFNSSKKGTHGYQCCNKSEGVVFAFPNKLDKLDLLVLNDSGLVYTTMNMIFVSNENKVVLEDPERIVLSTNGKSFIIPK